MSKLVTVTFNTHQIARMVEFYASLGANLLPSAVKRGGNVYRGALGNLELVLHSIEAKNDEQKTPRVSLRFELTQIESLWLKVKALPGADVIMDLESLPTGKSFIVIDPDGHSIEIFEKWDEGATGNDSA